MARRGVDDDPEDWESEEWDEDDEDSDDWASSAWDEDGDGVVTAIEVTRTVSFGFLSMLPLFVAYEWAFAALSSAGQAGPRSVAEALASVPLAPLGETSAHSVRRLGLAVLAALALVVSLRREWAIGPRLVRVFVEGAVVAFLLGPLLAVAASFAEPWVGSMVVGASEGVPQLSRAALVMGGAAWEELIFRVLGLALAYVIARRFFAFFGFGGRVGGWLAALSAAAASALLFATFHLESATSWLGPGGEPFDAAVFTWRAAAAMLLALVVLWRGVGVAAWAHALFNLAILIGIRPPTIH